MLISTAFVNTDAKTLKNFNRWKKNSKHRAAWVFRSANHGHVNKEKLLFREFQAL
jgi:hypothetical protein